MHTELAQDRKSQAIVGFAIGLGIGVSRLMQSNIGTVTGILAGGAVAGLTVLALDAARRYLARRAVNAGK